MLLYKTNNFIVVNWHILHNIIILLTSGVKKSFAEETTKLEKSAGSISLWKGNQKITSLKVYAPITGGEFSLTEPDVDSAKKLYNQLRAK